MSASTPQGFPTAESTTSYWQTRLSPLANHASSTELPQSADYVIIGSGITGTSIALKLLARYPTSKVVMLEARAAASGASSRNGGHCRANGYLTFSRDLSELGLEEALRIQKFEEDNVAELTTFVQETGVECDLRAVDTVDVFMDNKGSGVRAQESLTALERNVSDPRPPWFPELHVSHAAKAVESSGMLDATTVISFKAFKLHPYKLVTAMLERGLQAGLQLYTHTMVERIAPYSTDIGDKPMWVADTERGQIHAPNIILATNGYTPALHAPLNGRIIPTRGQVAAIRPGSLIEKAPALQRTAGVFNKASIDYFQARANDTEGAGDIIVGGGRMHAPDGEQPLTDDSTIHPTISKHLTSTLTYCFGEETWGEKGAVLSEWTGIMGYTDDKRPYIGQLPGEEGLWICAGFNGHGMALTYRAAEALVQLIAREDTSWIPRSFRAERINARA